MITINIEPADNGLIKYVIDDNVNGAGEEHVSRFVYNLEEDENKTTLVSFIEDLVLDLGLETGTEIDKNTLSVKSEWGIKYNPSIKEIKERIEVLEREIKRLSDKLK